MRAPALIVLAFVAAFVLVAAATPLRVLAEPHDPMDALWAWLQILFATLIGAAIAYAAVAKK